MEFVDTFGLDPNIAYTPKINDAMLDMVMQQNIDAGISPNFIHSMDASHMSLVIEDWDKTFGAVHDSLVLMQVTLKNY